MSETTKKMTRSAWIETCMKKFSYNREKAEAEFLAFSGAGLISVYPDPPGSYDALKAGCRCPSMDNAHGDGAYGGIRDENGNKIFYVNADCPLHGDQRVHK